MSCPCCAHDRPTLHSLGWRYERVDPLQSDYRLWLKFDEDDNVIASEGDETWRRDQKIIDGEAL